MNFKDPKLLKNILLSFSRDQLVDCCTNHLGLRRRFVIQEHDAKRAGLHWDLRFEDEGNLEEYDSMRPSTNEPKGSWGQPVLRSFAVPKAGINHRMPTGREQWLAIETEDHPWKYQDWEGEIEEGYGKGNVKLIFNDIVSTPEFSKKKIKFIWQGEEYNIAQRQRKNGKPYYLLSKKKS